MSDLRAQKVKVIANEYIRQKGDADLRPAEEIRAQMVVWAEKGWLSDKFIEECYAAISKGLTVQITYYPEHPAYGYLAGTPESFAAVAQKLSKGKVRVVNEQGAEIRPLRWWQRGRRT